MKPPKIQMVSWRAGRPRFTPGPAVRDLGFEAEDLKHADGRWFSPGEALDWSVGKQKEIEAARKKRRKRKAGAPVERRIYTVAMLIRDWLASPHFAAEGQLAGQKGRSPATLVSYRKQARALETHDHTLYHSAVSALTRPILYGLFEDIWAKRSIHVANGVMRMLSAAISWGMRRDMVSFTANPAHRMGRQMSPVRLRFATRAEISQLIAAADAIGRPEIGDMIALGVWTGQRQNDRLTMEHRAAVKGGHVFRQIKTGAIVQIEYAPQLSQRLEASALRRRQAGVVSPRVILDERRWTPFAGDHYRHVFAEVRATAIAGLPGLPPCPSLEGFRDQDLRDTAVTWLGLSGATIPEICSITGHSLQSATTILQHYMAVHPEMAASGIAKLITWFDSDEASQ